MNDVTATRRIEVPGYRLVRAVGASGAATVYLAMQRALERQVAVKVFNAADEAAVARFEPLLRTNARLSHPSIVGIHQIGHTSDGRLFHSMPFLLSLELSTHNLRHRPLKIAALMRELLDALGHAHRCGIVHGGIKPSNVLFDEHGHARLADFGIARSAAELGLPHPGAADYQSPEQARGNAPGQRSDLYSIGALAYSLLTGSAPFEGDDPVAVAIAHIEQPIPRLPPMVGAWQAWIDKALAKSPEQRFQSAGEMAEALSAIDGQHEHGYTPPVATRMRAPRWAIGATLAAVLTMGALTGWAVWGRQRPVAEPTDTAPVVDLNVAASASAPADPPPPMASANTAGVPPLAERTQALVAQADALRTHGHLFSPSGHNAVEQYFAVLALDPGNRAAVRGIDAIFATLRHRIDGAWHGDEPSQAVTLLKQCDLLAKHAGPLASRSWHTQRDDLAKQAGAAVVAAARAHDPQRLAALKPFADALPAVYPAGFDLAVAERMAATPATGARLRDRGGPVLIYVPAASHAPGFAIERVEVTRADYAAFVQSTHRPASRCLEAHNPFSRLHHLTWKDPGFKQGGNHPAVCVSWNDAVAYAAWLSKTTGQTYRLPDNAEWLRAAQGMPKDGPCQLGNVDDVSRRSVMDNDRLSCSDGAAQTAPVGHYAASSIGVYDLYGNVSEWLAGGSADARAFRGLSWRDGSRQTPLGRRGTADSDVGYTNVGFRLIRVIDAARPAPPSIASR